MESRSDPDGLLDAAPFGFLSFSDDGSIAMVNATALQMLGYQRGELLGRPLETLFAPGTAIFYQTHLFPLVRLHGHAEEIYLKLKSRAGEPMGALVNVIRRERNGVPANDLAFMRVTERERFERELLAARRQAEDRGEQLEKANQLLESQQEILRDQALEVELQAEDLRAAYDQLAERSAELERQREAAEEANRAKSRFLAVMSHELRTPLNAIGGYTQLLEMGIHGPVTQAQRDALARIDRSQRHLLRLINDVLNLARIESGRVEYLLEDLALRELVAEVEPMVAPQLEARRITFHVEVSADDVARADREKVQQVLLNLLGNAVKFTPEGGSVAVETHTRPDVPEFVFLRVSDTGPGIPASMLDSIFEPFVQVDSSTTRRSEGSGLGLAISRDLARGMGGELRVRSEEGKGSTFTIALPRARPVESPVQPAETPT
jgi:PAS domain S-box-containing protein